ncbi:unnamed protein product, partial [Amoebophrya sp. A120]
AFELQLLLQGFWDTYLEGPPPAGATLDLVFTRKQIFRFLHQRPVAPELKVDLFFDAAAVFGTGRVGGVPDVELKLLYGRILQNAAPMAVMQLFFALVLQPTLVSRTENKTTLRQIFGALLQGKANLFAPHPQLAFALRAEGEARATNNEEARFHLTDRIRTAILPTVSGSSLASSVQKHWRAEKVLWDAATSWKAFVAHGRTQQQARDQHQGGRLGGTMNTFPGQQQHQDLQQGQHASAATPYNQGQSAFYHQEGSGRAPQQQQQQGQMLYPQQHPLQWNQNDQGT